MQTTFRTGDVKEAMRLVVLCLIAWVVLAVAALASGGTKRHHGPAERTDSSRASA
jgi:hypothetical protein